MINELSKKTLGAQGMKILDLAQELEKSIKEQWSDERIEEINIQGLKLIQQAREIKTDTPENYKELLNFHSSISSYLKNGEEYCKPFKSLAKQPHTLICDIYNMFAKPGDEAKEIVSHKLSEYRAKEKKREEELQRKLEYERQQEEKKRREAEELKAAKALEKNNIEKAEYHLSAAEEVFIPPIVVNTEVKKTERQENGTTTSFVKDHQLKIKSKIDVIKAVAEGKLPETILDVNEGAAKKWAKACGHKNYDDNGIHIWEFERPVSRGARSFMRRG